MGVAEQVMVLLLAATMTTAPGRPGQQGGPPQDVDAQVLQNLELLRMMDLLRDLDAIRDLHEVAGPPRAGRPSGQGKAQ